jgi:hypothetical protein
MMKPDDNQQPSADEQLDHALKQWHQHSRQQHALDPAQRRQLRALVGQKPPVRDWRRTVQQTMALAACVLVLVVWVNPPAPIYQIEQHQQGLYTIQIHQLAAERSPASAQQTEAVAAKESARASQYQAYQQDYLRSQQQSAARTFAVWRERHQDGWQLQDCQHLQIQVQADLLAALREQQRDQQQWQLLEQSQYLQLTVGPSGQILALKPGIEAPHCAI